nr:hypothetical protein CFP56_32924 [Quercus suber]
MPTSPHPMDLLLSSLSLSNCASSLTNLFLNDCNLKAISNDIGSLFSLIWLDLSGNDFVCLPESIIQLLKLKLMNLNNRTSLRSLPKLPLNIAEVEVLSDHLWLVYVTPQFLDENFKKLLLGGDANGFCEIGIEFETKDSIWEVKKCGLHVIYKKDIEDLDRTMIQYSNSSITPYGDLDVFHHNFNNSAVVVECHKVKHSYDDCDGLDPVEKEALMTYQTQKGLKGRQKPKVTLIVRSQVSTRTVMKS